MKPAALSAVVQVEHRATSHIEAMYFNALSAGVKSARAHSRSLAVPIGESDEPQHDRAWLVLPIAGTFKIVYEDRGGARTGRNLEARELTLGPGRTLLGGIDLDRGQYRGFRADRIRRLSEAEIGIQVETGILDWLLDQTEVQRRKRLGDERVRPRPASLMSGDAALTPRTGRRPSV